VDLLQNLVDVDAVGLLSSSPLLLVTAVSGLGFGGGLLGSLG